MDSELDRFKSDINLVAYAVSHGYQIDTRESSRNSVVLRFQKDKIVVATNINGHAIYFSVHDPSDHGTIIDFIQRRQKLSLGKLRQHLRHWNISLSYCPKEYLRPLPSRPEQQSIMAQLQTMTEMTSDHTYLVQHRHLSPDILTDSRFIGTIKTDTRKNAIFPHWDRQGVCGYEIKNGGFTGFSPRGQKAFWHSNNLKVANSIVVVESALDALSHAQLNLTESAYVSVAGSLSVKQRDLIQGLVIKATVRNVEVVVATDNDESGEQYYADIVELAGSTPVRRDKPTAKDWNEQLRKLK